jgi:DNA-binding MurR/RpiR family transcriptional regulator
MSYRERIRAIYPHLSPGYRKVANLLLDDYRTAAFLNASGVAMHLDIDPATVVRFAQRLGYPGFPELAEELQEVVKQELTKAFAEPPSPESTIGILHSVIKSRADDLERLLVLNDTLVFDELLEKLLAARRVYLIGESFGGHIMELIAQQFGLAGIDARPVCGGLNDRTMALGGLGPQDIAIALAPYVVSTEIVSTLKTVHEYGLKTYAIVRNHSCPAARAADVVIITTQSERGPLVDQSVSLILLTSLAHLITLRRLQRVTENVVSMTEVGTKMMQLQKDENPDLQQLLPQLKLSEQDTKPAT